MRLGNALHPVVAGGVPGGYSDAQNTRRGASGGSRERKMDEAKSFASLSRKKFA